MELNTLSIQTDSWKAGAGRKQEEWVTHLHQNQKKRLVLMSKRRLRIYVEGAADAAIILLLLKNIGLGGGSKFNL